MNFIVDMIKIINILMHDGKTLDYDDIEDLDLIKEKDDFERWTLIVIFYINSILIPKTPYCSCFSLV